VTGDDRHAAVIAEAVGAAYLRGALTSWQHARRLVATRDRDIVLAVIDEVVAHLAVDEVIATANRDVARSATLNLSDQHQEEPDEDH
jgi:hypothetical protein